MNEIIILQVIVPLVVAMLVHGLTVLISSLYVVKSMKEELPIIKKRLKAVEDKTESNENRINWLVGWLHAKQDI